MEIGEGICVPVNESVAERKDWKLRAEVIEVTFKGGIKTSRNQSTIAPPHWKKGEDVSDDWADAKKMNLPEKSGYSKLAAAYLIDGASGASQDLEVKVHVLDSENVSGQGELVGSLENLEFTGQCPLSAGEHVVQAKIKKLPDSVQWVKGAISWGLQAPDPGITIVLGPTPVELFFLLATPIQPFQTTGVWAEALRFVCARAGVVGMKTPREVTARVATYCHTSHGLTYDTLQGAPRYWNANAASFALKNYLLRHHTRCNCYDQASAVQVLAGAVGVVTQWTFLDPFGYIQPANLIGVGMCNNPFFESNGSDRMIQPHHANRTAFGNHAFCDLAGKMVDACAGPHTATETAQEYINASIDPDPVLYPPPNRFGQTADLKVFAAVTSVS
jgi:hypothetical protein